MKLTITRGLPGSGKTTLVKTLAVLDGGRVVGRDPIREILGFQGVGIPAQENEVTLTQERLIIDGLKADQNVYVDDMNLKNAYVAKFMGLAEVYGAEFEVLDLTNVPVEVCVKRDADRAKAGQRSVGVSVIEGLHYRFVRGKPFPLPLPKSGQVDPKLLPAEPYVPDTSLPKAVLVDLDGTVALKHESRGFHDYDKRVGLDHPNRNVIRQVRAAMHHGAILVFISGRKGNPQCWEATRAWICRHITFVDDRHLFMRAADDNRPDWIVKREIFDKHIRYHYNVVGAFDDRNQVVDMYRELGLTVFQVAPGNF